MLRFWGTAVMMGSGWMVVGVGGCWLVTMDDFR